MPSSSAGLVGKPDTLNPMGGIDFEGIGLWFWVSSIGSWDLSSLWQTKVTHLHAKNT